MTRRVGLLIATLALGVLGTLTAWTCLKDPTRLDPVEPLIEAQGALRTTEGRLGGFRWAPIRGGTRSLHAELDLSRVATINAVRLQADGGGSAAHGRAVALSHLLLGDTTGALARLNAALLGSPADPRLLNDLSAAWIAAASTAQGFARALDAAERAIALDAAALEPWFNRALSLERAGLVSEAADGWREYLKRETDPAWSAEALERLTAVEHIVRRGQSCPADANGDPYVMARRTAECPQQAREHAERQLGVWAKAVLDADDLTAAQTLEHVRAVGLALVQRNGDALLRDTVAFITSGQPRQAATGLRAFDEGRQAYERDERAAAERHYHDALDPLKQVENPYWLQAQLSLATIHTHRRELVQARKLLDVVDRQAHTRGYHSLRARALWLGGVVMLQQSNPTKALTSYHHAAQLYERLGERGNVSNVMNAAADTERILGESARGWVSLTSALRHVDEVDDPTRRYLLYYNVALFCRRETLHHAALHYQRRALDLARDRHGPVGIIEGTINQAAVLIQLDRHEEATALLSEAHAALAAIRDPQAKAYQQARITAARGELLLAREPLAAAERFSAAMTYFSRAEPAEVPRLSLLRGDALQRAGQTLLAERAYQDGIAWFEQRLKGLDADHRRLSYADEGWDLYRRLMELKRSQGNDHDALVLSDRSRPVWGALPKLLSIPDLQQSLRSDQAVVHFTVSEESVASWVISAASVEHRALPVSSRSIRERVQDVALGLADPQRLDTALRGLHGALIEPLRLPPDIRELIIVPDGELVALPWPALRGTSGHYLIERFSIVVADAAAHVARPPAGQRQPASGIMAVGNPLPGLGRHRDLPALPYSEQEARHVAAMYSTSTLLLRQQATRSRFIRGLAGTGIVHFAGHAVANREFPGRSRLLLTPDGEDRGELAAEDLRLVGLEAGTLVILSACDTAIGTDTKGGAPQSLAQAFLAAGAGAVIASRWPVPDTDTSDLMVAFHRLLRSGNTPSIALQRTQVEAIASGRQVPAWAAFSIYARQVR